MSRKPKNPLRTLNEYEKAELKRISCSYTAAAASVARAKALLAVHQGNSYRNAAILSGRRSDQAVSQLVSRFNKRGIEALKSLHGGGPEILYGAKEKEVILKSFSEKPALKEDGTQHWSLSTFQARLKKTSIGHVSTYTIWKILHEEGYSFQKNRTWITTGKVKRKRGAEWKECEDPDKEAKKKSDYQSLHTNE